MPKDSAPLCNKHSFYCIIICILLQCFTITTLADKLLIRKKESNGSYSTTTINENGDLFTLLSPNTGRCVPLGNDTALAFRNQSNINQFQKFVFSVQSGITRNCSSDSISSQPNLTFRYNSSVRASVTSAGSFTYTGEFHSYELIEQPFTIIENVYKSQSDNTPITTTSFLNGFGNVIQSQLKLPSDYSIISGTYLDDAGREYLTVKPILLNTGESNFYQMAGNKLIGAATDFFNTLYPQQNNNHPYHEIRYTDDPLSQVSKVGVPGLEYSLGSNHHTQTWHLSSTYPQADQYFDANGFVLQQFLNDTYLSTAIPAHITINNIQCSYFLDVTKDPDGNFTQILSDVEKKPIRKLSYTGSRNIVELTDYDIAGNILKTSIANYSGFLPYEYTYNSLGQLLTKTTPEGIVTNYEYNSAGMLSREIESERVLNYSYDDQDRLIRISSTEDGINITKIKKYYDNTEQINSDLYRLMVRSFYRILELQHNLKGKLAGEYSSTSSTTEINTADELTIDLYSYTEYGQIEAVFKYIPYIGWNKIEYSYDLQGKLISKKFYPRYDLNFDPSIGYTEFTFTLYYTYDDLGRLIYISCSPNNTGLVSYHYDQVGRLINKRFCNPLNISSPVIGTQNYTYNIRDLPTTINSGSDNVSFVEEIEYEPYYSGNIKRSTYKHDRYSSYEDYTYDGINRLTRVESDEESKNETFSYSDWGTISRKTKGTVTNQITYEYNYNSPQVTQLNHITKSSGGQSEDNYTYDSHGNVISDASKCTFGYDWRNLVKGFVVNRSNTGSFVYDASGSRVIKEIWSQSEEKYPRIFYVDDMVFKNPNYPDENSVISLQYININTPYGIEGKINFGANNSLSNVYYYRKDHLGSVRQVVVNDGTTLNYDKYSAYGEVEGLIEPPVGVEDNYEKYTGKGFDEECGLNLYYFGARYYDPDIGTFISRDPYEQYWNPYSYCGGDPINYVDPNGKWVGGLIGAGIGAAIGAVSGAIIAERNGYDWWFGAWAGLAVGAMGGGLIGTGIEALPSLGHALSHTGQVAGLALQNGPGVAYQAYRLMHSSIGSIQQVSEPGFSDINRGTVPIEINGENIGNFLVGIGDAASFGVTEWIRAQSWYGEGYVDYNSGWYKGGKVTGYAASSISVGGSGVSALNNGIVFNGTRIVQVHKHTLSMKILQNAGYTRKTAGALRNTPLWHVNWGEKGHFLLRKLIGK